MTTITREPVPRTSPPDSYVKPVVTLERRKIDSFLIAFGTVLTAALVVAGSLLSWGAGFSDDYVGDELASQNISFPSAAALQEEGRDDLVKYADQKLDTGKEAEAYASYINGHLQKIADGATYAELGGPETAAKAAVTAAKADGAPEATVTELQAKADAISGQRNTLFKGETLRGLLLTAFAWSTVGTIAGYAAIGAFVAAAAMAILVLLGLRHRRVVGTHRS